MAGVPAVVGNQHGSILTITLNCVTNAQRMTSPKASQTMFLNAMRMTLKIHESNEEITVAARSFPALCAALLMELDNMFGTVHPNIFEGFKQFSEDGGDTYNHFDMSVPEENFTLELTK